MAYERIRNLREDKDLSQTQVAQVLNCSQRIYSNYERGDVDIPTDILIKLARFHQTSVDYLLGLTDDPEPPLSLTASERALVERYRTRSRDQKELLLNTAALMQKQNQR